MENEIGENDGVILKIYKMNIQQVQTIGHFLSTYQSDLIYLSNFQKNISKQLSDEEYLKKQKGSFYKYLIEFKVIRNIKKDKVSEVLNFTKKWVEANDVNNVDAFASELNKLGITHENKIMTSLASKILFLNNPYEIFPMDIRAKKSLRHKTNNYKDYLNRVTKFKEENINLVNDCLAKIDSLYPLLENDFKDDFYDLQKIRINRFIDKVLWIGI